MALHFELSEFDARRERLLAKMAEEKLDALLLFAQESMYWLTGYDTFGYCFFQTLVVKSDGSMTLLTRSADLRQARNTSIVENILIWVDRPNADPTLDLKNLLSDLDLLGAKIGVEYDTHGMTGRVARLLDNQARQLLPDERRLLSRQHAQARQKPRRDRLCAQGRPTGRRCAGRGFTADQARRGRSRDPGGDAGCGAGRRRRLSRQ